METLDLGVPTVHCTSCKLNIEERLDELHGVAGCVVDLDAKHVVVTYDPQTIDPATITATVQDAGYPVSS